MGLLLEEADILAAVFRSAQAPIATDPFCVGIAAPDMHTVGRFVAGLLAAHERNRANWVQIWTGTENPPGLDPRRDVHQRGRQARWSRLGHSISAPSGRRSAGRPGELPLFHGMVRIELVPSIRSAAKCIGHLKPIELIEWNARDIARGRHCTEPARGIVEGISPGGELLVALADSIARFRSGSLVLEPGQ